MRFFGFFAFVWLFCSPRLMAASPGGFHGAENHAVILVHGWGKSPRKPKLLWKKKVQPYSDLSVLKRRFEELGFRQVYRVEYDDLKSVDQMARTVADQIHKILTSSQHPDLRLDVVGHSMGQFVAAKAIVDPKYASGQKYLIADRVRLFIGLAGVVRGQDQLYPCAIFLGQCGGGRALEPFFSGDGRGSAEVRKLFSENFKALDNLKKCSVYSPADEIVRTPYNAASFRGLGLNAKNMIDVEINSRRERFHNDVKESKSIFQKIVTNCYELVKKS